MQRRAYPTPSRLSRLLLDPLSVLFKAVSFVHLGLRALRRRDFPGLFIVSADGLSFGGNGKTPLVMAIGASLEARGVRFAVVSRGYRSRYEKKGILVESTHTCEEVGDEPLMLKTRFPAQDVFIGRDRLRSIAAAEARGNRVVILDDGFQSSHIRKDFSILLLNPLHPYFYLRHFRSLAQRADRVLTYRHAGPAGTETYDFAITRFLDASGREIRPGDQPLVAFAALGDNERFARDMGSYRLVSFHGFADHHAYGPEDIRSLEARRRETGASWLVCTEKDFRKIKEILPPGLPLLYAQNEIQLPGGLVAQIIQHAEKKGFL